MAKKRSSDPAMRELERELQANTQALKDAYLRFDYVCDNDLVESCIFEINALKASRCRRVFRRRWRCRCRRLPAWRREP